MRIDNFPFLLVGQNSFFSQPKEVRVEKLEDKHFLIRVKTDRPRLYNINFREVLISPGDTVSLIFRVTDPDPDHHRDVLIVNGKNPGNYIFSNREIDRMPRSYFPDENQYKQKLPELLHILQRNYQKHAAETEVYLKDLQVDSGIAACLIREANRQLFYNLEYLEQKIGAYGNNKAKLDQFRDSLFANTRFVEADTVYSSAMETLFEYQLKYLINTKFKSVTKQQDFTALVDYVHAYPDPFIKAFFVYFLNEDYAYLIKKYTDKRLASMLLINPYIGRKRNQLLANENIYK